MLWKKKKKLNSDEYRELKQQMDLLWLEFDIITKRFRRKGALPKESIVDTSTFLEREKIDDGFDELRKLNKEEKQ